MKEIKSLHTVEEIREIFKDDRFATEAAGAKIIDAGVCYARCELDLTPVHRNAANIVMGGAIFTLADFSVAVASNGYRESVDTISIDGSIYYVKPAKGEKLIAEARCVKPGRTLSFYEVDITDELGTDVAHFTSKTYTMQAR